MFMCTSQILNRKVNNNYMHARDECIVNVSAASKILMPWGKDNKKYQTLELFVCKLLARPKNKFSCLFFICLMNHVNSPFCPKNTTARKIADFSKLGNFHFPLPPPPPPLPVPYASVRTPTMHAPPLLLPLPSSGILWTFLEIIIQVRHLLSP